MQCVFMYIRCSCFHWFRKKPLYGGNQAPPSCILIAGWLFESPSSWLLDTAHELQPTRYPLAQALVFLEQLLCCTSCNYKLYMVYCLLFMVKNFHVFCGFLRNRESFLVNNLHMNTMKTLKIGNRKLFWEWRWRHETAKVFHHE